MTFSTVKNKLKAITVQKNSDRTFMIIKTDLQIVFEVDTTGLEQQNFIVYISTSNDRMKLRNNMKTENQLERTLIVLTTTDRARLSKGIHQKTN